MALPNDMQVVPVILFKQDVEHIDQLARSLRQSRSEFLRTLIVDSLVAFSLPTRSSEETKESSEIPEPSKTITPVFEVIGKRRKLVGFDAFYSDHLVGRFDNRDAARAALDAYVYEELAAA